MENGFKRCKYDSCVYLKDTDTESIIYLLLYVDDMLIACKSKVEIVKVKEMLKGEFEMLSHRSCHWLGLLHIELLQHFGYIALLSKNKDILGFGPQDLHS